MSDATLENPSSFDSRGSDPRGAREAPPHAERDVRSQGDGEPVDVEAGADVDYERGDALNEAVLTTDDVSSALEALLEGKQVVYELEPEEYRRWLAYIVKEGRDLEQYLAGILDQIYLSRPAFYDPRSWQRLNNLLSKLQTVREDIRAFEYEVEDLAFAFTVSEEAPDDASVAEVSAESIRHTYDRAYDLCLYKLERMGASWITATNLLISVVMLVVTVLFWMEFW